MKTLLCTNWHLMRWIRLAFALFLLGEAYATREWFFIVFGLFLQKTNRTLIQITASYNSLKKEKCKNAYYL